MQKELLIDLQDVAWVTKSQDGKMKLHQGTSLTGVGASGGAMWGFLFGLLFLVPIAGMASKQPAGPGRTPERLRHRRQVDQRGGSAITPGGSALFVMARNTNQERVLPEMAKFGGTVIRTNLTPSSSRRWKNALAASAA